MPEPHCFGSLQVCRMRIAKLNASGSPLTGALNGYVTNALIEATVDLEIEEGDQFTLKNGCGEICQTFRDCDRLVGASIEMDLCHLDAELVAFMTGSSVIRDLGGAGSGNAIGMEFAGTDDACADGVSLEMWTKAWDNTVQATPPFAGGNTNVYFHFVFPRTKFHVGQLTFENDFMRVPVAGFAEENPRITSNGPFDDWPADIAARGGITNIGGFFLDSTIPTAACGAISVSSAAS